MSECVDRRITAAIGRHKGLGVAEAGGQTGLFGPDAGHATGIHAQGVLGDLLSGCSGVCYKR